MFGLGCFWGAEKAFWSLPGVLVTAVGYSGGYTPNPTYGSERRPRKRRASKEAYQQRLGAAIRHRSPPKFGEDKFLFQRFHSNI